MNAAALQAWDCVISETIHTLGVILVTLPFGIFFLSVYYFGKFIVFYFYFRVLGTTPGNAQGLLLYLHSEISSGRITGPYICCWWLKVSLLPLIQVSTHYTTLSLWTPRMVTLTIMLLLLHKPRVYPDLFAS